MPARILAIDDSEQNLILIELYLKDTEFEVITAKGGREALDLVQREEFDLILLDVVMPHLDGFDVCRRLKADPRTSQIPVVFLTARMKHESEKLVAFEVGAVDYINKPVMKEELIARIRVMLQLREARNSLERQNLDLTGRLQQATRCVDVLGEELQEQKALVRAQSPLEGASVLVADGGRIVELDAGAISLLGTDAANQRLVDVAHPFAQHLVRMLEAGLEHSDIRLDGQPPQVFEVSSRKLGHRYSLFSILNVSTDRQIRERIASRQPFVAESGVAESDCSVLDTGEPSGASSAQLEKGARRSPAVSRLGEAYRISGMTGTADCLQQLMALTDRLRNVRTTVLIYGESGTGKELVARALHYDGKFHKTPFIPIHCGAIAPELIESELFGYDKGAFTGALSSKDGLFTAADGGSVFLDEVAETPASLQVKLLRVLQQGEIRPVGATHAKHIDVRIIAATNKDLTQMVRDEEFREDLYYRLDIVTLRVPPLRERIGDVPALTKHFLDRFNRLQQRETKVTEISKGAMHLLQNYSWPGNVREFENAINRAFALGCGEIILESDLPDSVRAGTPTLYGQGSSAVAAEVREGRCVNPLLPEGVAQEPSAQEPQSLLISAPPGGVLRQRREEVDRATILSAIDRFAGDKKKAMEHLGMSRSTFYRVVKKFRAGDPS